jgi:hypothetical protein
VGRIPVVGRTWHWVALDAGAISLNEGNFELRITTRDTGIAIDHLLVTNDPNFVPRGRGQVPEDLPIAPAGLRVEPAPLENAPPASRADEDPGKRVRLTWQPVAAPQGVSHYNVYRSESATSDAQAETLLSSPSKPAFMDTGLKTGMTWYYRIRAVDAWGNQSAASEAVAVTVK